jgi:hypothetical protein
VAERHVWGTAWRTASWVRWMDWPIAALPTVAMTLARATPTIVPVTPKNEAMTAARTEAAHEAMTWIGLIFMDGARRYRRPGAAPPGTRRGLARLCRCARR